MKIGATGTKVEAERTPQKAVALILEREGGALSQSDKKHSYDGYFEGRANRICNWIRCGMGEKRESKVTPKFWA